MTGASRMGERPLQLIRRRLGRHENERARGGVAIERAGEVDEMRAIPGEIGSAKEAGAPGVNLP